MRCARRRLWIGDTWDLCVLFVVLEDSDVDFFFSLRRIDGEHHRAAFEEVIDCHFVSPLLSSLFSSTIPHTHPKQRHQKQIDRQ